MCGRFTLFATAAVLSKAFDAPVPEGYAPRYNISPSASALTVRALNGSGRREFALARWGLVPSWARDPSIGNRLINARAETVHEKPAFRAALRSRRCLVPSSGFYEWRREGGKQPYFIRMKSGEPFGLAGIWESWTGPDGTTSETFSILTTAPNAAISPLHDRMPVILEPGVYDRWLDPDVREPDRVRPFLSPYPPEEMEAYPVGRMVNRPYFDEPSCIAPLP